MRTFLIFLAVLLVALAGYAYVRNPTGCEKLLTDAGSIVTSVSPVPPQPDAASQISPLIQGKLISADGSPLGFPAKVPVSSIQYYAIYYSAQWCPPCHAFSPVLVEWYRKFKPSHLNFELIFVSEDHDAASMLGYMKEMAMPWPAVRFGDLKHDGNGTFKGSGIEKFAGSGIPDLVLVDAGGKVLSDSFTLTGSYLGPLHVLDDIEKLVPSSAVAPVPPAPPPGAPAPPSSSPAIVPVPAAPPAAPTASVTVAAPPTSVPAANPSLAAVKPWAPPDVMPAHPNWTWNALDGTTYQNVVVTKIEAHTVTITHSLGVAHIPINLLPPDIQKQLNYDPHAASPSHPSQ